jgi:hypothetical protein
VTPETTLVSLHEGGFNFCDMYLMISHKKSPLPLCNEGKVAMISLRPSRVILLNLLARLLLKDKVQGERPLYIYRCTSIRTDPGNVMTMMHY